MAGILITKGITPGFPPGALKITLNPDGTSHVDANLHLHLDVISIWLRFGLGSLREAKSAWRTAKKQIPESLPIDLLEQDFQHSMLAIVSFAIAVDAMYARLHQLNPPIARSASPNSRHAQVSAQILRCFKLSNTESKSLCGALKQLYNLRDRAVHPTGALTPAVLYPEIDRGVEHRFELYRAKNISGVAQDVLNIFTFLFGKASLRSSLLNDFQTATGAELKLILSEFSDLFTSQ